MEWNTFSFQLIAFVLFGIIKGYFHLDYLKEILPKEYEGLNYFTMYITGSHYKCPQLMWPYVESVSQFTTIQKKKYLLAWLFTVIEISILFSIILMVFD